MRQVGRPRITKIMVHFLDAGKNHGFLPEANAVSEPGKFSSNNDPPVKNNYQKKSFCVWSPCMVSCMVLSLLASPIEVSFCVWQPCMATVYGPCMVSGTMRNHTDKFFGASPYADYAQECLTQTIRKPHFDRPYATVPEKSIRGQSDVIVSLRWNH